MDRRLFRHALALTLGLLLSAATLPADQIQYSQITSLGDFEGAQVGYDTVFKVYGMFTPLNWTAAIDNNSGGTFSGSSHATGFGSQQSTNWSISRSGTDITAIFGGARATWTWAPDLSVSEILMQVNAIDQRTGQSRSVSVVPLTLNGSALGIPSLALPQVADGTAYFGMNHFSLTNFTLSGTAAFAYSGGWPSGSDMSVDFYFLCPNPGGPGVPEPGTFSIAGGALLLLGGICWGRARVARFRASGTI